MKTTNATDLRHGDRFYLYCGRTYRCHTVEATDRRTGDVLGWEWVDVLCSDGELVSLLVEQNVEVAS